MKKRVQWSGMLQPDGMREPMLCQARGLRSLGFFRSMRKASSEALMSGWADCEEPSTG